VGARNHVLDGSAHWRNLANTIEPFMCGGDAEFFSNYFDHLLSLPAPRGMCNRRCLSVCLSVSNENFRTDLYEIFREGWHGPMNN